MKFEYSGLKIRIDKNIPDLFRFPIRMGPAMTSLTAYKSMRYRSLNTWFRTPKPEIRSHHLLLPPLIGKKPKPEASETLKMVAGTTKNSSGSLKFLCSYGGKILPRSPDGKLRYAGGLTRVLSVDRSISFAELMVKLGEFCGYSVDLKCQLPNGDLETLISVKSDEDLSNIIEEYDRVSGRKIRAVLSLPRSHKHVSPPPSGNQSPKSPFSAVASPPTSPAHGMFLNPRVCLPPADIPSRFRRISSETHCCSCQLQRNARRIWY
ncbi:PREDICTED: uncharacterized protein LOC104821490 [Tarenaya hassleriana]|uniref:uncharacterized protein LOC104821490 n=1 Tax=Tarenaya hassleriana TaxID=28532 RepID=UPI00053C6478|nr:PREDICTED: uncharacterized protein LOC104821490 [Tarenaya hassleriana]